MSRWMVFSGAHEEDPQANGQLVKTSWLYAWRLDRKLIVVNASWREAEMLPLVRADDRDVIADMMAKGIMRNDPRPIFEFSTSDATSAGLIPAIATRMAELRAE